MDRLDTIELFAAVVETGSFSEAGKRFGYAPSGVTRRIDDLEAWMGAALFYRSTRRITLTEVGAAFHNRATEILLDLEEARITASGLEDVPSGNVRLSVAASLGPQMTAALGAFLARWPDIGVTVRSTDQLVDPVAEGLDLVVRIGRLSDSTLRARLLGTGERIVCASPQYLRDHGTPSDPDALAGHDCLVFRSTPGYNLWRFRRGKRRFEVRASGPFHCDDGQLLTQAAASGGGIVLLPRWLVGQALEAGSLVPILENFEPDPAETPVHAVYPHSRYVPPKVRVLIDFLVERFGQEKRWIQ